jgi:hypothetical protein
MPAFTQDRLSVLAEEVGATFFWSYGSECGLAGGRIVFPTGWELSVSYGPFTYSDGGQTTTETAIIRPSGEFYRLAGDHDDVQGHQTWDDVVWLTHHVMCLCSNRR